jgi:hypothetical protein
MIPDRDYYFEYLHQTGYDVFSRGWSMATRFDSAFGAAGTRLRNRHGASLSYPWNPNLPPDSVLIQLNVPDPLQNLWDYVLTRWSNGQLHDRWLAALFAVRAFKVVRGGNPTFDTTYSTVSGLSVDGPFGWSFILVERILATGNSSDNIRKDFDRVVIHEMGHQRGFGSESISHFVHTGANTSFCVMHNPVGPGYPNTQRQKILDLRDFCQGHQQKLYNIYWRR